MGADRTVIQWETEPGTTVEAYAYNGMVPGPQLRADVGDRIQIVLHNELPQPTTIHSHGLIVPNGMDGVPVITQPAVMPGESFTYEFTVATRARTCTTATSWPSTRCRWGCWAPSS